MNIAQQIINGLVLGSGYACVALGWTILLGVARLVSNGDEPAPVPVGVVEALQSREDAAGFIKLEQRPPFRAGEKVRVLDGAF